MNQNDLPEIDYARCNRCELCITSCPEDALMMSDQGPIYKIPLTCTYCLACENACPTAAIRAPLRVTWITE